MENIVIEGIVTQIVTQHIEVSVVLSDGLAYLVIPKRCNPPEVGKRYRVTLEERLD